MVEIKTLVPEGSYCEAPKESCSHLRITVGCVRPVKYWCLFFEHPLRCEKIPYEERRIEKCAACLTAQ